MHSCCSDIKHPVGVIMSFQEIRQLETAAAVLKSTLQRESFIKHGNSLLDILPVLGQSQHSFFSLEQLYVHIYPSIYECCILMFTIQ